MLGLGQGIVVFLFVHAELRLHAGFFVKNLPDCGGFVPAMFLIGEGLEGSVEGKRQGDRDGGGFLGSHAAEGVIVNMAAQGNSMLTKCMIQSYTCFMPRTRLPKGSVPVTFRLPRQVQKILAAKARREKISFSELVRRALGRETKGTRKPTPRNDR